MDVNSGSNLERSIEWITTGPCLGSCGVGHFINDIDEGVEGTLMKSASDAKLERGGGMWK